MELKEFVENTLVDIVKGIKAAQDRCNDGIVEISPGYVEGTRASKGSKFPQDFQFGAVEFSIVLGADIGAENTAKGGIQAILSGVGISAGASRTEEHRDSQQTTVRFAVPIKLPVKKG